MQIKQFPNKETREAADLLLLQDATDNQFKNIKIDDLLKDLNAGGSGGASNTWEVSTNGDLSLVAGDRFFLYSPGNINISLSSSLPGEIELKRKDGTKQVSLSGINKINGVPITPNEEVLLLHSKYSTKLIYIDSTIGWLSIPSEDISVISPLRLPTTNLIQKFYAFDINATENAKIPTWIDTVSGLNATQSDTNSQAIYKPSIFNSLPGVFFTGNAFYGTDLNYLANKRYTVALVEARGTTSQAYAFGQDNANTNQALHIGYRNNTSFTLAQFSNDLNALIEGYTSILKPTIWVVSNSSRGKEIWRNNIKIASNNNIDNLSVGTNGRLGRATNVNYQGYLGLVATWIEEKTTQEIQNIFSAINSTFRIY